MTFIKIAANPRFHALLRWYHADVDAQRPTSPQNAIEVPTAFQNAIENTLQAIRLAVTATSYEIIRMGLLRILIERKLYCAKCPRCSPAQRAALTLPMSMPIASTFEQIFPAPEQSVLLPVEGSIMPMQGPLTPTLGAAVLASGDSSHIYSARQGERGVSRAVSDTPIADVHAGRLPAAAMKRAVDTSLATPLSAARDTYHLPSNFTHAVPVGNILQVIDATASAALANTTSYTSQQTPGMWASVFGHADRTP